MNQKNMAFSRNDRKEVFKFFETILLSSQELKIHYERLRGHVSTGPEIVRKYVRGKCKGENLLEYFKKRKNYFYVSDKYFVGLVKRRDTHQLSDNVCEMKIDEFCEYDDNEFDEYDIEGNDYDSFSSSKSNSAFSPTVSTGNSACGDDVCNTSRMSDETKRNEKITLRYFCKKLENGEERTVDSLDIDSKKARRYLKKYWENDVRQFLCNYPGIFYIDDHDCVSLISNPFLRTTPYQQEIQSVSLESSTANEIQEESFEDSEKQTIDNVLYCADFFVEILKKKNPIHIDKLSGYLSNSPQTLYLKVNYSHFSQFFHDIPQLFILDKNKVSLFGDSARLLKEAKKLYSKSKNVYSSMLVEDAIKLLFSRGNKSILSEINEIHIPEIRNSDLNKDCFSNETNSILFNNTLFNEVSSSTEYSSSKDTEVSKMGFEVTEKSKSMVASYIEDKNITESQIITPMSCPEQNTVQKLTVHETKTLVDSKLENTHCSVLNSCNFTDNKILQIMISWEEFFDEIQNFFNAKNMDTLIDVNNKKEISCMPSRKDMSDFVGILYTVELLCLEKIEEIHNLKLQFDYKAVKFFTEILEKNLTVGCGINSLRGSLSKAPSGVLCFMKQLYKGEKIKDFFKSHEEFIISHELVKLSPSYKNTLHDKLLDHEKYTNGKKSYSLGELYNSDWFKTYVDAYGCFCEIFCFLARKEKHESKLNRLSGFVSKLSFAQQDFINSFSGNELPKKTECFLNSFRIFSYFNEGYVKIDPDCHIAFLSHCVKRFADLLKDEKIKLSDFCYLLNNHINNNNDDDDCAGIKSVTDLRSNIVESVETFLLAFPSYLAYSTLPSILDDILLDLVIKQIFSFGIINVLEECSLFQMRNKKISLKKDHMDEINHSNENFNNIAADTSSSNCGNAEVSQRESNVSHLINGVEDKSETDEMKMYNSIKLDWENKTSESQDINLYCTTGKVNLTEITDFETAKDLSNININSYLNQNTEERTSENDKISNNGVVMNNDNNDIIKEILKSETVNGKEILPNLEEKISTELSKNFCDFAERNDLHNSLLTETNQNIDSEGEDKIFHKDDRSETESPDILRKEALFVLSNSSLINESLERKLADISFKESDPEIYDVGPISQSKIILNHEFDDKLSVTDSVSPASLTGSDIKVETDTLIMSPPETYSVVPQLQKVANIEICSIDTCEKKLPVGYISSTSEQHTEIAPVNKKHSFTCEYEIEELKLRPEYLSNDSKLDNRKLDVSIDSDTLVCDVKDSRETINENLLEKLANVTLLNEEESENSKINEEQPIISEYEAEEFRSRHEFLSCDSKTNNRELNLCTDSNIGECDLKNCREGIYDNLSTEKCKMIVSPKEQSDEPEMNDKLYTNSNALICDLKKSTETINDNLLSENGSKIECIQTIKGFASQDFHCNRNSEVHSSEELITVHAGKFRTNPPAKEKQSSSDLSAMSDMKSKKDEKEIINQMSDHCCSEEVIQDLPVNSLEENTFSKNIEEEPTVENRSADNENYQDEPDTFISDASCFANFYSADSTVSEVAEIENISSKSTENCLKPIGSESENLSVSTLSFSEDSSRKSSDQNDNNYSKNCIHNQNLDASFFQPLSAKVVLLTLDSCVAKSTINGENKLVFCLKSYFHCDQHTDCQCFDSLAIGDKVSCYIPPEGMCKLGNMGVSFMFCKDTAVVEEECQISNSFECKELNKGYQFMSLNSKENLQLTENVQTNNISKFTLDKIYTQSKVHSATNKNRNSFMLDKKCQAEYPECSQVIPYVKEFGESECQTVLSGRLRSYPSVDEKECQVKYSSFSKDIDTQTAYKSCKSECQTVLSGEIKLCAPLTEKECQVKCPTSSQDTQTLNNSTEGECQTELSGKIKSCPSVSQKECQVKWEMLPQGTQTLNSCNEEECQTDISGNIKFCSDSSSFGCQTVISGNVKKYTNLANKSSQTLHISSLSNQTTQTSDLDSSSENDHVSHVQSLDWASDIFVANELALPESNNSMCDTACQTISTGPVMIKNFYFF